MLISPEGHKITCALKFGFKASNNKAEYEAFLGGLRLAKEMKVGYLQIFSDSQLVVKQVTEEYQARGERMAAYLKSAQVLLKSFDRFVFVQGPPPPSRQNLIQIFSSLELGNKHIVHTNDLHLNHMNHRLDQRHHSSNCFLINCLIPNHLTNQTKVYFSG